MKILLVYPKYPETFWSFKYAYKFIGKKAGYPPLGLLTVASLLPQEWEKKLIDLNVEPLKSKHLKGVDYVFISAMDIQKKSALEVVDLCKKNGIKIVAGGPFFSENYENLKYVDHIFIGEAEATMPEFIKDLKNNSAKHLYKLIELPDLEKSPMPMWELINVKNYNTLSIQYSRGCPFNCEFCCITSLFGRKVRTKNKKQIIGELEAIYRLGWRSSVFFVDDNFIGNARKLKSEILPAIIDWMKEKKYPFQFVTQTSLNLADDEELMKMMAEAGFYAVFLGIETVDDDCFVEAGKFQNRRRDLVADVKKIQQSGMEVWSGFILGFDSDKETIFDKMANFIQKSGITIAMVGLLTAIRGTKFYKRLVEEKRLIFETTGNNVDYTLNFIPKMDKNVLLWGYKNVLNIIYSPKNYYQRIKIFFNEFKPTKIGIKNFNLYYLKNIFSYLKAFVKVVIFLGIIDKGRIYFWRILFWSLFRKPQYFAYALSLWVYGYHFRKSYRL